MIKLIASDLDGTMLRDGTQILDPEYFDIIHQLAKKGICFVSASGHQYNNQRHLFAPVRDEISFISENGAHCIHQGNVYLRHYFNQKLALRIIKESRAYKDCGIAAACEGFTCVEERNPKYTRIMDDALKTSLRVVHDLTLETDPLFKIAIWSESDNARRCEEFQKIFQKECDSELRIMTSGDHWIDFNTAGVNKGTALKQLTDMLHIDPRECVAFGDQYNDMEMLQFAGTSYVVSTCAPGMETYATHVTDSVLESLKEILRESETA